MADTVETIQAEQDRVIRARHYGVLVVQGEPGTGKTAVALHRAAFPLYKRQMLEDDDVLDLGLSDALHRDIGEDVAGEAWAMVRDRSDRRRTARQGEDLWRTCPGFDVPASQRRMLTYWCGSLGPIDH